jgi:anti-anti-sigma factor
LEDAVEDGLLSIDVIPHGHSVELRLRGELDLSTAAGLTACLEQIDGSWRTVTLNMAELTFMDSTGVGLLVTTQRRFGPDYRTLQVRDPRPNVHRVLEMSGLDALIPIISTQPTSG